MQIGSLHDLQRPGAGAGDGRRHLRPLIAAVGEDALDKRELTTGPTQQLDRAVAVLHVGGMDHDVQEQTERVDENVPLAAGDLLARVIALRIDRRPPFCAALAL